MKVFISWSGDVSQAFAASLAKWLPNVIQAVEPFFSRDDIRKGTGWLARLNRELEQTDFGILCVTSDNKDAAWLLFEAGALAKKVQESHVCPLLIGIDSSQLKGPLSQFQATVATRDDMLKLVRDINSAKGEKPLINDNQLMTAFEKNWSDLEEVINTASAKIAEKQKSTGAPIKRTPDDMLEEILNISRGLGRQMEEIRMETLSGPGSDWPRYLSPNPAARGIGGLLDNPVLDHPIGLNKPRYGMTTSRQRPVGGTIAPNSPPNVQASPTKGDSTDKK